MNLGDGDSLMQINADIENDCSLHIKEMLQDIHSHSLASETKDGTGVRLPKLDVPTFTGDILHWQTFSHVRACLFSLVQGREASVPMSSP